MYFTLATKNPQSTYMVLQTRAPVFTVLLHTHMLPSASPVTFPVTEPQLLYRKSEFKTNKQTNQIFSLKPVLHVKMWMMEKPSFGCSGRVCSVPVGLGGWVHK